MGRERGQELPEFGSYSVVADQQAPGFTFNRAGPHGMLQRGRNQRLNGLESIARLLCQTRKMRKGGRIESGLLHRDGVVVSSHVRLE